MNTIDIFIGGPMGNPSSDGQGSTFNDHMELVAEEITAISEKLNKELAASDQKLILLNPTEQSLGTISSRVFSMIDRAEVGVFVLSCSSPSAMYELTLMHALGKPVVPIAYTDAKARELVGAEIHDARTLPHYLRDEYAILVESFTPEELREKLEAKLRIISGLATTSIDPESNPITRFYGLPLLDVSATTGLATGYFVNFLQYQLKNRETVFSRAPHLKKFVILKPSTLDEVGGMLDVIKRRVGDKGLEIIRLRERDGKVAVAADEQVRGEVILDSIGEYVFDIPAPLKAQKASPRYRRLIDEEKKAKSDSARDEVSLRKLRLETAMIDKFFSVLRSLSSDTDFVSTRLEFLTLDEFFDRF